MSNSPEKKLGRHWRRGDNSLFGPIVLIAIGVYFLLSNLGYVTSNVNWVGALQLWPLALILMGINIIVRQAPGVLGGFLSALVGLLAVAIFGYVLFFSEESQILERFGVSSNSLAEVKTEQIAYPAAGVETADINIDFGLSPAEIYALSDSVNLIEGTVSYTNNMTFEASTSAKQADVRLKTSDSGGWFFLNPRTWMNFGSTERWCIGLNPWIPMDLRLDVGAGAVNLDLSELTLTDLELQGGAGSLEIMLPGGDYDVFYDASAGSTRMTLPAFGRQNIDINGSAGSLTLYLPPGMAARVEVDGGVGSFSLNEDRFHQVSGDQKDEGVWETAAYKDAANQIDLMIDVSAGSVRVEDVQGR